MSRSAARALRLIATFLAISLPMFEARAMEPPGGGEVPALERAMTYTETVRAQAIEARAGVDRAALEVLSLRSLEGEAKELLLTRREEVARLRAALERARGAVAAKRQALASGLLDALRRGRHPASSERVGISDFPAVRLIELLGSEEAALASLQRSVDQASELVASSTVEVERISARATRAEEELLRMRATFLDLALRLAEAERRGVVAGARHQGIEPSRPPSLSATQSLSLEHGAAPIQRAEARPSFQLPVEGSVLQRFGDRRGDRRLKGIVLLSDHPQAVRAPGMGRVAYAGPFGGLGLLLIIDHGNDYHSLVIGASRLVVGLGETVSEGQIVGWLDGDGPRGGELYLELRRVGEPVDPFLVLSAREGEVRG